MLNLLLSFAQFEREVTCELIRDKIAASKAKGLWMGSPLPLGYDVVNRKLVINPAEASIIKRIFSEFPHVGSTTLFVQQLRQEGVTTKSWTAQTGNDRIGKPMDKGALYKILNNPIYVGDIRHKGQRYPGEHEAIVTRSEWDKVQEALASSVHGAKKGQIRTDRPALLKGLIFTFDGHAMTPHATKGRGGRLYRYYLSTQNAKQGSGASVIKMLPAGKIEEAVMVQIRAILRSAEVITQVWRAIDNQKDKNAAAEGMTEIQVAVALSRIDEIWDQLFPLVGSPLKTNRVYSTVAG
jgi:hypothetical protein